jgi:hypothetical protein
VVFVGIYGKNVKTDFYTNKKKLKNSQKKGVDKKW